MGSQRHAKESRQSQKWFLGFFFLKRKMVKFKREINIPENGQRSNDDALCTRSADHGRLAKTLPAVCKPRSSRNLLMNEILFILFYFIKTQSTLFNIQGKFGALRR